ncbi:MAG: hypothetical protein ACLFUZ_03010 [Candidatus Micrarchaeia archaeon]
MNSRLSGKKTPVPLGNKRMRSAIRRANNLTKEYGALIRQIREAPLSEGIRSTRRTKVMLNQKAISGKKGAQEQERKLIELETEYERKKDGIVKDAKGCLEKLAEQEGMLEGRSKTSPSTRGVWAAAGIAGIAVAGAACGSGLAMQIPLGESAIIGAACGLAGFGLGGLIGISMRKGERKACEYIEENHGETISGIFEKWRGAVIEFEKKSGEVIAECRKIFS